MVRTALLRRSRPLRRAVSLLLLTAAANALLVAAALAPRGSWLRALAPLSTAPGASSSAIVALGLLFAALSVAAAWQLSRVSANARALSVVACVGTMFNAPFGTVVGLAALAHLREPRVRRIFVERGRARVPRRALSRLD